MREIQRRKIYNEIANELDLPPGKVKEAVEAQFRFLSQAMSTQVERGIRLPFFGRFYPDQYRVRKKRMVKWSNVKEFKKKIEGQEDVIKVTKELMLELIDTILLLYERNHQLKSRKK